MITLSIKRWRGFGVGVLIVLGLGLLVLGTCAVILTNALKGTGHPAG